MARLCDWCDCASGMARKWAGGAAAVSRRSDELSQCSPHCGPAGLDGTPASPASIRSGLSDTSHGGRLHSRRATLTTSSLTLPPGPDKRWQAQQSRGGNNSQRRARGAKMPGRREGAGAGACGACATGSCVELMRTAAMRLCRRVRWQQPWPTKQPSTTTPNPAAATWCSKGGGTTQPRALPSSLTWHPAPCRLRGSPRAPAAAAGSTVAVAGRIKREGLVECGCSVAGWRRDAAAPCRGGQRHGLACDAHPNNGSASTAGQQLQQLRKEAMSRKRLASWWQRRHERRQRQGTQAAACMSAGNPQPADHAVQHPVGIRGRPNAPAAGGGRGALSRGAGPPPASVHYALTLNCVYRCRSARARQASRRSGGPVKTEGAGQAAARPLAIAGVPLEAAIELAQLPSAVPRALYKVLQELLRVKTRVHFAIGVLPHRHRHRPRAAVCQAPTCRSLGAPSDAARVHSSTAAPGRPGRGGAER